MRRTTEYGMLLRLVCIIGVTVMCTGAQAQSLVLNSGAITIDTDALSISGSASASGMLDGGVAKFNFDVIDLGPGVNVTLQGSNPLSLNALGNITIGTTLDASGGNGQSNVNNPGPTDGLGGVGILGGANGGKAGEGSGGPIGQPGSGLGGGGGQAQCCFGGAGGGFGGEGGTSNATNASERPAPGAIYGDAALTLLQGGSGGGGGAGSNNCCEQQGSGGGAGGGAIELRSEHGAIDITSTGEILVDGGDTGNSRSGGGGSGGAIRLDAGTMLTIDGLLSAEGGESGGLSSFGTRSGGSGGGGRIALFSPELEIGGIDQMAGAISSSSFVSVLGGNGSNLDPDGNVLSDPNTIGGAGTIQFTVQESRAIPEPASIALWLLLGVGGTAFAWYRRRRSAA